MISSVLHGFNVPSITTPSFITIFDRVLAVAELGQDSHALLPGSWARADSRCAYRTARRVRGTDFIERSFRRMLDVPEQADVLEVRVLDQRLERVVKAIAGTSTALRISIHSAVVFVASAAERRPKCPAHVLKPRADAAEARVVLELRPAYRPEESESLRIGVRGEADPAVLRRNGFGPRIEYARVAHLAERRLESPEIEVLFEHVIRDVLEQPRHFDRTGSRRCARVRAAPAAAFAWRQGRRSCPPSRSTLSCEQQAITVCFVHDLCRVKILALLYVLPSCLIFVFTFSAMSLQTAARVKAIDHRLRILGADDHPLIRKITCGPPLKSIRCV